MTIFLIHLSWKINAPTLISAPTPIVGEKTYLSRVVCERPRASAPVKKRVRGGKNWNLTEATRDSNIFISLTLVVRNMNQRDDDKKLNTIHKTMSHHDDAFKNSAHLRFGTFVSTSNTPVREDAI